MSEKNSKFASENDMLLTDKTNLESCFWIGYFFKQYGL